MTERQPLELGPRPIDMLALSVDTSDVSAADRLIGGFKDAGGSIVKLGLELQSARGSGGPEGLSDLADKYAIDWIYDGKIKDIGNTMKTTIGNIVSYDHPPMAITMHADTSLNGMKAAQEAAGEIPMLGVTLLTDIGPEEAIKDYGTDEENLYFSAQMLDIYERYRDGNYANEAERLEAQRQAEEDNQKIIEEVGGRIRVRTVLQRAKKLAGAGVKGLVASPKELVALRDEPLTQPSLKLIPGTRSLGVDANDQQNVMTPEDAIANGADLLVIGRQYTGSTDRAAMLEQLREEVARGLKRRKNLAIREALATDTFSS